MCYLCSSVFTSSVGLQTHIAEHGPQAKPYDCNHCDEAFFFRAELEHHLIDHELGKVHLVPRNSEESSAGLEIKSEMLDSAPKNDGENQFDEKVSSVCNEQEEQNIKSFPEINENNTENYKVQEAGEEDDEYIEVEHSIEENKKEDNDNSRSEHPSECSE